VKNDKKKEELCKKNWAEISPTAEVAQLGKELINILSTGEKAIACNLR